MPGIDYGVLDSLLGYALRRAQIVIYEDFVRTLSPWNITPQRFSALTVISGNPSLKLTQLAHILGIEGERVGILGIGIAGLAWAVVPFLDDPRDPDPRVVLIRQWRHATGGYMWEIPAGRRDAGEDPLATAHRELLARIGKIALELSALLDQRRDALGRVRIGKTKYGQVVDGDRVGAAGRVRVEDRLAGALLALLPGLRRRACHAVMLPAPRSQ